jgi:hypothetical protein
MEKCPPPSLTAPYGRPGLSLKRTWAPEIGCPVSRLTTTPEMSAGGSHQQAQERKSSIALLTNFDYSTA